MAKQNIIAIREGTTYQKCSCCGSWKIMSKDNYYKDNRNTTGFKGICKACKKDYYSNNRVKRLSYQNSYNESKGVIHRSAISYNKFNRVETI